MKFDKLVESILNESAPKELTWEEFMKELDKASPKIKYEGLTRDIYGEKDMEADQFIMSTAPKPIDMKKALAAVGPVIITDADKYDRAWLNDEYGKASFTFAFRDGTLSVPSHPNIVKAAKVKIVPIDISVAELTAPKLEIRVTFNEEDAKAQKRLGKSLVKKIKSLIDGNIESDEYVSGKDFIQSFTPASSDFSAEDIQRIAKTFIK